MPDATYGYNLDGDLTGASGADFASIARNAYTRLPEHLTGRLGNVAICYDSFGRRLHSLGEQTVLYRNGIEHPTADRTKELSQDREIHHTLAECVGDSDIVYVFTPAGQTVQAIRGDYARVVRDHLRSVRAEVSAAGIVAARYGAYGDAAISGGCLRRAFAGYEPDLETGLFNAGWRLYSPETRCFVSVDPRLQSVSPYPYCDGDPFNRLDPTGAISSTTIAAIVSGLLLVASVVITILTAGAAAPASVAGDSGAVEATVEVVHGIAGAPVEQGAFAAAVARHMPSTVGGFIKFGVTMGAVSSALGNGAGLVAKAANGEHISAWQAVRRMIVEPAIAGVAGGIGGAIGGSVLATPGFVALSRFGMSTLGSIAAGVVNVAANAVLDGRLSHADAWESIGISMGVAVAEALILTPVLSRIRLTHLYELNYHWERDYRLFMDFANYHRSGTPVPQRIRLHDVFLNPDPQISQHLRDCKVAEAFSDSCGHGYHWHPIASGDRMTDLRQFSTLRRVQFRDW